MLEAAEQHLRAAARGANHLAAAAKRRMLKRAESCGSCSDAAIAMLQILAGIEPTAPEPRLPQRHRPSALKFHVFNLTEAEDEPDFVWVVSAEFLCKVVGVVRGCTVLHPSRADERTAALVAAREAEDLVGTVEVPWLIVTCPPKTGRFEA